MIEISHLTKRFGRATAVDDVSLMIGDGESVALWGANGAGKTTIIRCVLGLYRYRGTIRVSGFDARKQGKLARQRIGYVPQELGFYDDLRVHDAVRFFGKLHGVRVADVDATLGKVGLAGHSGKRIRELSGGMKQRLALAIALLGDPRVLVLDEVTASLDACGRGELVSLLSTLTKSSGQATLFASHRVEEIEALATRVLMLERGRVTADLSVREFLAGQARTQTLHVYLDREHCPTAIELLERRGFAPRLNGRGLFVPVTAGQRALPLRALAEGDIHVDDFEMLDGTTGGVR